MESVQFIGAKLVSKCLKYSDLIPAVQKALTEYSANRSAQPLRNTMSIPGKNGTFLTMPSYSKYYDALVTKLVGLYPGNAEINLPTHHCYIMLFDSNTGKLICMMDGEVITAMRTATASVVATQAIGVKSPKTLGVLGSGVQAKSHITAFCDAYNIEKINVWGRSFSKARKLCSELGELPVHACESAEEAVTDADVVVTATHATEPVLCGKWLKPGCHINCIGACRPMWRECDDDCLKDSVIYVDSRESAENESGDIILTKSEIYAEVGDVLSKQKEPKSGKYTFFKSLGIGLEDSVAANLVWESVKNT